MKTILQIPRSVSAALFCLFLTARSADAATRYVWLNSPNPAPPYTNWATAAHVIQDAVDAAAPGDTVLVTNGVYATGVRSVYGSLFNRVAVTAPLTLLSVNGPEVTSIVGSKAYGEIRCVYLTNGASLSGFTLTNGATLNDAAGYWGDGGGLWCESTNAVVSNCVVTGNSAYRNGGGVYQGTLNNCALVGNWADYYGGGATESVLNNSTLTGNRADMGGGADSSRLNNCTLTGNWALAGGGAFFSRLNNCTLTSNFNEISSEGSAAVYSILTDCTLAGNSGWYTTSWAVYGGRLNNCIVYYNPGGNYADTILDYCCTTPQPTNGIGNITNAPLFMDTNGWSNLRLRAASPCINAGNNAYVTTATDLDGNPRIVGGTVDMGAYEFQSPGSVLSYAWAQQYGLPTDGSADFTDSDADGHNNWQEWKAWTGPTNALSVLKLLPPQPQPNGMLIRWQSVSGQTYLLERAPNVGAPFSVFQSNILGQAGTTSVPDTNFAGNSAFYYRVAVPE